MDHEQFKDLLLTTLENANEDFTRQALLALGHGYCSVNAHPHSDQPFSAEERDNIAKWHKQRAEQTGEDLARERERAESAEQAAKNAEARLEEHMRRADTAEQDAEWYRQRLEEREHFANNLEARLKDHKQRADAYADWLARHHDTLEGTANAVRILLFQYGEEDRIDG
jgi:predicted RNase H-like nuclease (RuvC/YqgF family)